MFETNRDPFESLREQWGTAQELAVGTFQKAQERADIREGIEREEARYQQTRTDALSAEARRTALEQLRQLDEALAQMDPDDPEDAEAYQQGILARNYLTGVLGQEGQGALSAIAEGRVQANGRLVPVGEAVAAAGAQGRRAGDRRTEEAEERAHQRERELNMLGFTFQSREAALQRGFLGSEAEKERGSREALAAAEREFNAMMAEAERELRRGLTTQQIAAQLHEQFVSLGFQGDQAALDRALQREIEQGRIDLETKRLNAVDSAALAAEYRTAIALLDPNIPEDRAALSAIREDAQASGMTAGWISVVLSAIDAQAGRGAQQGFEMTDKQIADLEAATAARLAGTELTEAQVEAERARTAYVYRQIESMNATDAETRARTEAAEYELDRQKVVDGRADIIEFQDFVVNTTALGALGLPVLQQMLFDIENGIEDSIYAPYMDFVTPEMLEAAIEKATNLDVDGDLSRAAWIQQTKAAIIDGNLDNIGRAASLLDPQELYELVNASDDDPMFQGENGQMMRWLRESLGSNPAVLAAAQRQAGIRKMGENQPQIASATSRLEFYAGQRPDDLQAGEAAVRGALQVLADNGLFGDPLDPDGTAEMIEDHVAFYRRAWGDQEGAFNADMAESAARTALNNANAALVSRNLNGPSGGPEAVGADLETLKFMQSLAESDIEALEIQMESAGCLVTDALDRQAVQSGDECAMLNYQLAQARSRYTNIARGHGYFTDDEYAQNALMAAISEEVDADPAFAGDAATDAERNAEVVRRYRELSNVGTEEEEEEPAPEPREPRTAAERGADFRAGVQSVGPAVAGAVTSGVNAVTDFLGGALGGTPQEPTQPSSGARPASGAAPQPQMTFDNPGLQQLASMPYSYGGRQMTVGEAWQMAVSDPTMRVAILEHVMSQSGIDRPTATAALNQLITGR